MYNRCETYKISLPSGLDSNIVGRMMMLPRFSAWFSLRCTDFSAEQTIRMLQLLNLMSLEIIEHRAPGSTICQSHLFSHFLVDPGGAVSGPPFLLPRLKTFRMVGNGENPDHGAFIEAIRSRWIPDPDMCVKMGVNSLRSVEVMLCDKSKSVPESLLRLRLKELTREGLKVWVQII